MDAVALGHLLATHLLRHLGKDIIIYNLKNKKREIGDDWIKWERRI